jgi:hypothetical protein
MRPPLARSQPQARPVARTGVTAALIALSIVLVAFNDLVEFLPLGEIAHDAFIVILPILMLRLMLWEGGLELPQPVVRFVLAFSLVVLAGIAMNFGEISNAFFKGRSGTGRILTQSMILAFGVLIIIVYYRVARIGMVSAVVKGARGAILVMAFMGVLEFASWYSVPGLTDIHTALANVIHSDSGPLYVERLRMTAFEVSWAGALLSFFLASAMPRASMRRWPLSWSSLPSPARRCWWSGSSLSSSSGPMPGRGWTRWSTSSPCSAWRSCSSPAIPASIRAPPPW